MEKILKAIIQETNRLNNEGRTSEAIYLLEQIASNALNGLALSVHQHNSNDKAIKYLDMALKVDCGSWIPHSNKCHIYNVTGHYQEARESSLKALEYCNQKTHLRCLCIFSSFARHLVYRCAAARHLGLTK